MGARVLADALVLAPADRVYAAWVSAETLARWWWPHITDTTYEVDASVGGHYDIRSTSAGIGVQGEFTSLDPPREIGMTWRWMTDGVSEVEEPVVVTLEPEDGGTRVRVRHDLDDIAGSGDGIREGWTAVLDRLAALDFSDDG